MTRIAVVGASGVVGRTMLEVLERQPISDEMPVLYGSARSQGSTLDFRGARLPVRLLGEDALAPCDVALFSAGSAVSRRFAPRFVEQGTTVIDNSSAFRMERDVPLVVPEINAEAIPERPGIIANPNCSTIILLLALHPLCRLGPCRCFVATYQAVSGAGRAGLDALRREQRGGAFERGSPFPFPIAQNLFPWIGDISEEDGATAEECKMAEESRKILGLAGLELYATCVRVPVERCHSEAVTLYFDAPVSLRDAAALLERAPGLRFEPEPERCPTPAAVAGLDEVWAGRLRQPAPRVLQLWLVGDQLLKGAALNAVQIARGYLRRRG